MRNKVASDKMKYRLNSMMNQGPCALAAWMLELDKQFLKAPLQLMTIKADTPASTPLPTYSQVGPEDLEGEFRYFFVGDPLRDQSLSRTNQQVSAIGLLGNPVFTQTAAPQGVVKTWAMAKQLCESTDIPWQEVLVPVEDVMQAMQQQQQQQADMLAQQQMQGLMGMMQGGPEGMMQGMGGGPQGPQGPPSGAQPGTQNNSLALPQIDNGGAPTVNLPPIPTVATPVGNASVNEQGGMVEV
jgi:hypothetical protein